MSKTYVADENLKKVFSGEMTAEDWMAQAEEGPEVTITEEKDMDDPDGLVADYLNDNGEIGESFRWIFEDCGCFNKNC